MHVPPLISESSPIRPNFKLWKWKSNVNTRSAQAKPLYKIKKTLFGGPSNLNCPFGVLLCLTIWTVAKMFEACIDQNLELEGKKAGNI